ncbi:hypothetical protein CJ177_34745 [Rhodococcus sp. ACPA1]|nr:hypothetical protein CJ177_34745 [Rhodococcus sp. ACPA1]
MMAPRVHLDDVLDLAIFWAPIGEPTPGTIQSEFGIDVAEYRRLLLAAIQRHQQRPVVPCDAATLDRVYSSSVLAALAVQHHHTPSLPTHSVDPNPETCDSPRHLVD